MLLRNGCIDSVIFNDLIGLVGLGTVALSAAGLVLGIRGLKERDKNYITCKVGIAMNGVFLAGLAGLFIRGLL